MGIDQQRYGAIAVIGYITQWNNLFCWVGNNMHIYKYIIIIIYIYVYIYVYYIAIRHGTCFLLFNGVMTGYHYSKV